jgi:hypothetical protein
MQKHVKWLRISYWAGAVIDLLAALQMLAPQLMALTSRWENFQPGADYRFAMGMGAPLMLGWTALLLWADRDPVARKGILPITVFPVIVGSAINYGWAVRAGLLTVGVVLPLWLSQTILTGLFLTSYALNTPLKDRPLAVMLRSLALLLSRRAHFPAAHLGDKLTREDGQAFRVFREVIVAPRKGGLESPAAIFRVWFYAAGPTRLTRPYSWLTTLLFFGMAGFRHNRCGWKIPPQGSSAHLRMGDPGRRRGLRRLVCDAAVKARAPYRGSSRWKCSHPPTHGRQCRRRTT